MVGGEVIETSFIASKATVIIHYTNPQWMRIKKSKSYFLCVLCYMIAKYSNEIFESSNSRDLLDLQCELCGRLFKKTKNSIQSSIKGNPRHKLKFCSLTCCGKAQNKKKLVSCKNCNKEFLKSPSQIKKTINSFCSSSCAAFYNNTHKTHGYRRSKLEIYFEQVLPIKYPDLEFHFNRKDAINSELDIYIPKLNLAFELNGIFHYEPIYGTGKLNQTQNNDRRKFQACLEQGIELCIIDASSLNYFKLDKAQKYLDIILSVIDKNRATHQY